MADVDYARLCDRIPRDRKQLEFRRAKRVEMVREYVGKHCFADGNPKNVPVNLISLYLSIVAPRLVAKNPRVMASTFDRSEQPAVLAMERSVNHRIEKMNLAKVLRRGVFNACFSMEITKVALAAPHDCANTAWKMQAGKSYAWNVDEDDFVYNTHARDLGDAGFTGHRLRCPLDVVRDDKKFSKGRKSLTPTTDRQFNTEGDERISMLGRGWYASTEDFEDMVDLWEIYLPRHRIVCTFASDDGGNPVLDKNGEPLLVQKWVGPDEGPYHYLGFGIVPGNALPLSPIMNLLDEHLLVNESQRKLHNQAKRLKSNTVYQRNSAEDAKTIQDSNDGEMVGIDAPDKVQEIVRGGPSQVLMAFVQQEIQRFSWLAGNLDMMGGLSPQSHTATQDKLLAENASASLTDKQEDTLGWTASVCRALMWYDWHDPQTVAKSVYSPAGMPDYQTVQQVHPWGSQNQMGQPMPLRRQLPWDELDLKVDPYSIRYQTPAERVSGLTNLVQQIIMPMMPILQQQGIAFDVNAFLSKIGRYMDMPDLAEIMSIQEPQSPAPGGDGPTEMPSMGAPPQQRVNVRENRSQATSTGRDRTTIAALLGSDAGGASKNGKPPMPGAA